MNIEEAVYKLEFVNRYKTYKDTYSNMELDAIETVLNELGKKDKVIDIIVDTIVGDRKILKLICNRIINKNEDECFEQNILCDDCIKEYFYKKADEESD